MGAPRQRPPYSADVFRRVCAVAALVIAPMAVTATALADSSPPPEPDSCFSANPNGDLPTCTTDDNGKWQVDYPPGGSDNPLAIAVPLFLIAAVVGGGLTAWRVSTARSLARRAGMDPGQATAITLLGNDGLDAAYVASAVRTAQQRPEPVVPRKSTEDRLRELDRLRAADLVTDEEYARQRGVILDSV